jgi:hypothetical protein
LPIAAQNVPGNGWSSFGLLPFRGYDFRIMKAPTQYIMYFTHHADTGTYEGPDTPHARAFSPDMKTWTLDTADLCSTSGDLCKAGMNQAGVQQLPDGRLRLFQNSNGNLVSLLSSDGIVWKQEPGVRFSQDTSSIYERGSNSLQVASFVNLPDGSVRMYYSGVVVNGTPGTPAYYNSTFANGMMLSAISKDGGLTFAREPGVRVNPLVQGPTVNLTLPDGTPTSQFDGTDLSAIAVQENGRTVYRIYAPSLTDPVSYLSTDGLTLALEGTPPAMAGDPRAFVLPDGRTWLVTNQYPDALDDMLVYGPESFAVNSVRAAVQISTVTHFPAFRSVLLGISGTSNSPVTLDAPVGNVGSCPAQPCSFHPEYYSFAPASGTPPFSTVMTYTGPSTQVDTQVVVHAKAAASIAAGNVDCMSQLLGRSDTTIFCGNSPVTLPLTSMTFGFSPGTAAYAQTSSILSEEPAIRSPPPHPSPGLL